MSGPILTVLRTAQHEEGHVGLAANAAGPSCCDRGASVSLPFFFSSRRRHTRCLSDWSSDVCSSDLFSIPGGRSLAHPVGDAMTDAANKFLASLGAEQRAKATFEWKSDERENWHFIPREQIGRASCRERVWVQGGGVAIRKKR